MDFSHNPLGKLSCSLLFQHGINKPPIYNPLIWWPIGAPMLTRTPRGSIEVRQVPTNRLGRCGMFLWAKGVTAPRDDLVRFLLVFSRELTNGMINE